MLNLVWQDQSDLREQPAVGYEDISGPLHIVPLEEGTEVSERRVKLGLEDSPYERRQLLCRKS